VSAALRLPSRSRRVARPAAHATDPPPAGTILLRLLAQAWSPPRPHLALAWVRTQGHASLLADLARTYLAAADTDRIERLLRAGRHGQAAQRFCERFSARCFPLEYAWTGAREQLLVEVTRGIQHEGYGDDWEEYGDLWSLRPVFQLSWALAEDPYGPLRDEFVEDELGEEEQGSPYRLCDEAREAVAHLAQVPVEELFAGLPPDGIPLDRLRPRLEGTCWEPLLWAAPWLWRLSGNAFLDHYADEFADPEPWSVSTVLRLAAEYREAVRVARAIDAFDARLCRAPAGCARAAVAAALGQPSHRLSTLLDLPLADGRAGSSHPDAAPAL
jgi:hypothetical protein